MPLSSSPRTTLHRLRERGRTDRDDLYQVLDAGLICHLGVVVDGAPLVLPTGYGRLGDTLYLHGSSANRSLLASAGQEVCVTVTLVGEAESVKLPVVVVAEKSLRNWLKSSDPRPVASSYPV